MRIMKSKAVCVHLSYHSKRTCLIVKLSQRIAKLKKREIGPNDIEHLDPAMLEANTNPWDFQLDEPKIHFCLREFRVGFLSVTSRVL